LTLPEPEVLAKIKAEWRAHRKPANVMVVFDNSGSMGAEDKLTQAKQGLKAFFAEAAPQDRIGLTKFSTDVTPLVPIAPMATNRAKLEKATDELFPEQDTRLRDAIVDGVQAVQDHLDKNAINAVVVLTDGQDTASGRSADQAVRVLSAQGEKESGQIRVFTIAYGSDANTDELARYARATGGKPFTADTSDIEKVYRSISSFF
jgi:Ca-activated chloride channel family protein